MEKELKKLLKDLKGKETLRKDALDEINAEMARIDLREETETERFIGEENKPSGIYDDIGAGLYNHRTEGQMQKIIDEELRKIKEKYDAQRAELGQKIEETKRQHEEEKSNDYKKLSSAIKDYHLDMVLEVNKENEKLSEIESERNGKLEEIDKLIAEKEAERTHLMVKNRDFMDIEASSISGDIRFLGEEIERLKAQREGVNDEYVPKLKAQSDTVQYCNQQKERASKFLGSIILSEKSIDEIYEILFQKEKKKEQNQAEQNQEQQSQEQQNQEQQNQEQQNQEQQSQSGQSKTEQSEVEQSEGEGTQSQGEQNKSSQTSGFDWSKYTSQGQQNQGQPSQSEPSQGAQNSNKTFSYKFSAKEIIYDGIYISLNRLLSWYEKEKETIEKTMKNIMGEKEGFEDFLEYSDKLIYLSMLYGRAKDVVNGEFVIDEKTKSRLGEYYDIWTNPKKQEKSNMQITYDLKRTSAISRFFQKSKLTDEQVANVKENAFLLRKRKDVTIKHGVLSKIEFFIKDKIESAREMKLLNEGKQQNGKKENKPSWLLTEEELEQANEPVQQLEQPEKDTQQQESTEER